MQTLDKIIAEKNESDETVRSLFARTELFADVHVHQPNVVDRVPVKFKKTGRRVKGGGDPVTLRVAEVAFAKCLTPRLEPCLAPCLTPNLVNQTPTLTLALNLTLMLILTLTVPALAAAEPAAALADVALAAAAEPA